MVCVYGCEGSLWEPVYSVYMDVWVPSGNLYFMCIWMCGFPQGTCMVCVYGCVGLPWKPVWSVYMDVWIHVSDLTY
jgi:hypothetical protein